MKIYEFATNPSSRRVGIFLKEMGIEVERIQLDVRAGANLNDNYIQQSINGKVPMLELDDGDCISESIAICRYFAHLHRDTHLFGDTAVEVAKIEMWHRLIELDGLLMGFQAFRHLSKVYSDRERCVPEWGAEAKLRVTEFLPKLEAQLAKHKFAAGDKLSIADITAFIFIDFISKALEIKPLDDYAAINKWYYLLAERAAFQA